MGTNLGLIDSPIVSYPSNDLRHKYSRDMNRRVLISLAFVLVAGAQQILQGDRPSTPPPVTSHAFLIPFHGAPATTSAEEQSDADDNPCDEWCYHMCEKEGCRRNLAR